MWGDAAEPTHPKDETKEKKMWKKINKSDSLKARLMNEGQF